MRRIKAFDKSAPADSLRVTLCDISPEVADSWLDAFGDADAVEILVGSVVELDADAILSPANSFGDMGGGVDKVIDDHYRGAAQAAAQEAIRERFLGELPVGMATLAPLPPGRFRYLLVAPTMRVPGSVRGTVNAYLAFRGALVTIERHNASGADPIRSLAVPGLCTGVGGMDSGIAAEQMRAAYDSVIGGSWRRVVHPAMAPFAFGQRP